MEVRENIGEALSLFVDMLIQIEEEISS